MKFECDKCALKKHQCCLTGEGPKPADLLIIGQCPGPKEREFEQIFVGPSGKKLNEGLEYAGLIRSEIYITNAVKGFVIPGKTVNKTSVRICSEAHLIKEIEEVKPKVILCTGSTAASSLGYRLVANSHFYDSNYNCYIVLTHHPAKLLRTNNDKIHNEFMDAFVLAKSLLNKVQANEAQAKTEILEELTLEKLNKLGNPIALDLETGGLDFTTNPIVSVGLSDGVTTYGIPVYNNDNKIILKDKLEMLKEFLTTKDIIGHNLKFDYKFLKRNGISIKPFFDTMLAHFLIDREALHGLAELSLKYLHTNLSKGTIDFDKDFKEGTIDVEKYSRYVANDAWMTYKLYEKFKLIMDNEYPKVFYVVMMPTLEWLANAEERGVKIDRQYVEEYINTAKYELIAMEKEIQNDDTVKAFCEKEGIAEFNIRSPKQVANLLYDYLKLQSKIKKTGEDILKELANRYPQHLFLQKIVDYRHLYKSYRTYLQNLIKFSEADGRIHCTYNQCRVPSGRLASAKPNLQNIPKSDTDNPVKKKQAKIIRHAFMADEGYALLEADFSQAEFRALAHYSRDPYMIDMINEDRDIHKMIASVSYLKPENQVTKAERKIAKTIVFGIMYGRGAKSIAESLQISFKEAENIRNTFLGTFKQAEKWINGVQNFVKKTGYVKTLTGRKVTLPAVYSKDKEQVAYATRCAVNYPIQGIVGDMTNLSGALVHKAFREKDLDAHLIMNIHDSIIVECRKDLVDIVKPLMKDIMENKVREVLGLRVKIKADIQEGKNLAFDE